MEQEERYVFTGKEVYSLVDCGKTYGRYLVYSTNFPNAHLSAVTPQHCERMEEMLAGMIDAARQIIVDSDTGETVTRFVFSQAEMDELKNLLINLGDDLAYLERAIKRPRISCEQCGDEAFRMAGMIDAARQTIVEVA